MKRIVQELANKRGRGTELISLYIPAKKPIHEVISALREEYGTAANIKSDQTRNNVQDALVKVMQRLKLYRQTPKNGLAVFCGALPTNGPGSEVVKLFEVHPHKPITTYLYRCDDHFHIDILKEMLREERVVGILSIDTNEAGIGLIVGNRVEVVDVVTSGIPGKHRAGGQSARRFERLREAQVNEYFHRVANHAEKVFLENHNIEGLIVSGPGPTKDDFLKGDYLDYRLKKRIIGVVDTSYSGSEGVRETLKRGSNLLENVRITEEAKLVQRFLKELNSQDGAVVYGIKDVIQALKSASVDVVIVSEDIDVVYIKVVCKRCKSVKEAFVSSKEYIKKKQMMISEACKNCEGLEFEVEERDLIEYLDELATNYRSRVEVISSRTEEGVMLKSFGGIASLLRYKA